MNVLKNLLHLLSKYDVSRLIGAFSVLSLYQPGSRILVTS